MAKESQYPVTIEFTPLEQQRLKRFVGLMGYETIRGFVRDAVLEKIENDLINLAADKREFVRNSLTFIKDESLV